MEAYAKKFGIDGCVTFNTTVKKVDPVSEDGVRYRVVLQNEKTGETYTRGYENVVVANGHHWDPAYPDLPGHFTGLTVHAHDYRTNEIARGKRCLVLGVGNSGGFARPPNFSTASTVLPPCTCLPVQLAGLHSLWAVWYLLNHGESLQNLSFGHPSSHILHTRGLELLLHYGCGPDC